LLQAADVIVYDYLSNPAFLQWARPGTEVIYAGKKAGDHTLTQEQINALLVEKARAGKTVVRLKGGDPFVFGRGGEEAQELRAAGVPFSIVPGISSALAGPAYAGIPVTHREATSAFTVFTGHLDPAKAESDVDYAALVRSGATLVMLMGVERLALVTAKLLESGAAPDLPVALVRWATTPRQESISGTLADIAEKVAAAGFKAPAIAVFGKVVDLRAELAWFEERPLFGKRVVVTRTRKQASGLSAQLAALGADVLELPTIRVEPSPIPEEFADIVRDAHTYDWLLFTSPNGVEAFFEQFYRLFRDAREIGGVRIAAIGPATAAKIAEYRLQVDLQPAEYVAEAVVKAFGEEVDIENLKILLVRPESARDVIFKELSDRGAIVDLAIAYRTVPETEDPTGARARLLEEGADLITFTSSSTVENFLALNLPLPAGVKIASIGPITTETALQNGLRVDIEAQTHSISGLVTEILRHYQA
jgi:uroporphyrinogen III methyltransferase/synthase